MFLYEGDNGGATTGVSLLPAPGGGLRAFFAGLLRGDPHDVGMSTATSADGVSWAVQPTLASASQPGKRSPVYAAQGIGGTIEERRPDLDLGRLVARPAGYHVGTDDKATTCGSRHARDGRQPERGDRQRTGHVVAWGDIDTGRTITQSTSPAGPWVGPPGRRGR